MAKGNAGIRQETNDQKSAVNQGVSKEDPKMRGKLKGTAKGDMGKEQNKGSRLSALKDLADMEEETVKTNEQPQIASLSNKKGKQSKTLAPKAGETGKVKLRFSHAGMDSSMGSLDGLTTEVSTQGGQYVFGSKADNSNEALKDITNKVATRPSKMKYSKPISKLSGTKRPGRTMGQMAAFGLYSKFPNSIFNFETFSPMGCRKGGASLPGRPTHRLTTSPRNPVLP